jgi:predicted amidohydrolase YtcJ
MDANVIVKNAKVITVDKNSSIQQAVAVNCGKIILEY